jgi:hypothetical protein
MSLVERAAELRADPSWEGHGTLTGYHKVACRCDRCRQAMRERARERTAENLLRPVPEQWHGTANGYGNYGCRCDPCKAAISAYKKEWALRRKAAQESP